jgi:transmembrane sensor
MSSETTNWEAVARYLAGESPADEQAAVRQWLADHPADAKMVGALDDVLGRLTLGAEAEAGIDVEAALARVKARRGTDVIPLRRSFNWVPIAAAAGIVLVAGLWWSKSARSPEPAVTTIAARTLKTPVGGRDSLVLPDGSQVMLGPGSELTMAEGYGQAERRVTLRGEALFTVVHNASKPFTVVANGAAIRDVGTAFVVHSDAGGVRVAVTEGVVELATGRAEKATLKAGDAASVSPAGMLTAQRGVGAGDDLAWTRGKLVFRDAPLSEVSEDLARWYGVHLDIQDAALRRRPLSASFDGDSIRQVLDVISRALGASMERRGDTVVVRSAR